MDGKAGHYERKLETRVGNVKLPVPKLRRLPFETRIIERYLAGVSVRRVENIIEALWATRVSSRAVSRLNQKIYHYIEAWRNREITGEFPYVYRCASSYLSPHFMQLSVFSPRASQLGRSSRVQG